MPRPSFFIVGAPKSGTTSLCEYLDQHPDIFICKPKEPDFFGSDLKKPEKPRTPDEYLGLFEQGVGNLCGEGSTIYFLSRNAPKEIHDFNPDAKIIIMLREPVSLLYSLHSQLIYDLHEDILDFAQALDAESERRQGKRIPKTCRREDLLLYRDVVNFSKHVERYINQFGRDRVKVIIFDDFAKNPEKIFQEVLFFLELGSYSLQSFISHNSNKKIINHKTYQFFRNPPDWLFALGNIIIPETLAPIRRKIGWKIIHKAKAALVKSEARKPMNPILRKELTLEFSDKNQRLSSLLERDLSSWNSFN